jgi:hypothetical protein
MDAMITGTVLAAFNRTAESYRSGMLAFYPTVGSRGVNEINQVHSFLLGLRETLAKTGEQVVTWLESPFLKSSGECKRDRLDGVAYSLDHKILFLLEAKRIKQGRGRDGILNAETAVDEIYRDAERLCERTRIDTFCERLPISDLPSVNVVRMVLADIWLNEKEHMKLAYQRWLSGSAFPGDWQGGLFEASRSLYEGTDSAYRLLLAVHPELITLDDCRTNPST